MPVEGAEIIQLAANAVAAIDDKILAVERQCQGRIPCPVQFLKDGMQRYPKRVFLEIRLAQQPAKLGDIKPGQFNLNGTFATTRPVDLLYHRARQIGITHDAPSAVHCLPQTTHGSSVRFNEPGFINPLGSTVCLMAARNRFVSASISEANG